MMEGEKVERIEAQACLDHIHRLVGIPPYVSVSRYNKRQSVHDS